MRTLIDPRLNNKNQVGLTFIELLVALSLGLFLITATIQVFFTSQQTYHVLEGNSLLQNNARFGLTFIGKSLKFSGYTVLLGKGATEDSFPSDAYFSESQVVTATDGVDSDKDVLRVRYKGNDDGLVRDCLGNVIAQNETVMVTYEVNANGELLCTGKNGAIEVIVSGVDDFQVLLGVDSDNKDAVTKYVEPSSLSVSDWANVMAVKVGLLVNSEQPMRTIVEKVEHTLLAAQVRQFEDRLLRREFVETFSVRNRAP